MTASGRSWRDVHVNTADIAGSPFMHVSEVDTAGTLLDTGR